MNFLCRSFFKGIRAGTVSALSKYATQLQECVLRECSVSSSRDGLFSTVDKYLSVADVCSQFGSYIKLVCELSLISARAPTPLKNAFAVLMANWQRDVHNKKDQLYNDLVFLKSRAGNGRMVEVLLVLDSS